MKQTEKMPTDNTEAQNGTLHTRAINKTRVKLSELLKILERVNSHSSEKLAEIITTHKTESE